MTESWTLSFAQTDLTDVALDDAPVPAPGVGQALLRVDRVGLTANNVTYGLLGKSFRYWEFFPTSAGRGLVPLWGFGDVVASNADRVTVGERLYGYYPTASHLVVTPGRVDVRGFRDTSAHRASLPSPYNTYALTTGDSSYLSEEEDLHILYRPLFFTSFMLADQLEDNDYYGAEVIAFSSASSKTAYGTAFLLQGKGNRLVGLTSTGNVEFTKSLGVYDEVVEYGDLASLSAKPTVHVDVSGSDELRGALGERLGEQLLRNAIVGIAHQQKAAIGTLDDERTLVFFAPDQMRKRSGDWGREGLDEKFAAAWKSFAPFAAEHIDVVVSHGPEALRDVWLEVLGNKTAPRVGNVIQL